MKTKRLLQLARMHQRIRSGEARTLRIEAGLSQTEVADGLGVSFAAISRWERGSRKPSGRRALAYAHLLDKLTDEGVGRPRRC